MEVGLIGLGKMGTGIAKSLLRAGHRVTVFNRTRARAEVLWNVWRAPFAVPRLAAEGVQGSLAEQREGELIEWA